MKEKKNKKENKKELSKLEDAIERLEKQYGKGTVLTLDNNLISKYNIISTGSIGFDWKVLGIGGFAKGRLHEIMGWDSTGKTTICAHTVAECQRKGGKALYIDGEHCLNTEYFSKIGVDIPNLMISQPSSGEEGFNIALEIINTGEVDMVIIDSDSSLIPKSVVDGEVGDMAIGAKARLNSNAYPKIKQALVNNNVCVIVISQYREKIGVMYGPSTVTQGGNALRYYADCRIELSRSLGKNKEEIYGNITKVKTIKNKTYAPYKNTTFDIIYGKGIDRVGEVFNLALDAGIIVRSGSWFSYKDTNIGQGEYNSRIMIEDNPELYEELKEKVLNVIKNEL